MRDILFQLPFPFSDKGLPVHAYGVMAMLGFLAAWLVARHRAPKAGISRINITDLCFASLIGGIFGARIFFVVQEADFFFNTARPDFSLLDVFKIWKGGLVFYGGLFGAFVVVLALLIRRRIDPLNALDVITPSLCLGMAFGRIGCFLHGCCYGAPLPANPWYAVVFPLNAEPYKGGGARMIEPGTPLFPSQIVSSINMLILFAVTSLWLHRRKGPGEVTALTLILYSVHRFAIEFFRGDTRAPGEFSIAQWISLPVFFTGLIVFVYCRLNPRPLPEPVPADQPQDTPQAATPSRPANKRPPKRKKRK